MAALSALLKTWVILQTLCLALAQVVSGQGRLRPALLRLTSIIQEFQGIRACETGQWAPDIFKRCYRLCAVACAGRHVENIGAWQHRSLSCDHLGLLDECKQR